MPLSIQVTGLEELISAFDQLQRKAGRISAEALYEGAGVMADSVSHAVQGIATEKFRFAAGGQKRKASPEEKALLASAPKGVAKFKSNGNSVQTSVGFQGSGYGNITWNHAKTAGSRTKYKQGDGGRMVHASMGKGASMKPVPLIVNSINSGTSFMEKQPFLRKAFNQKKGAAQAAIEAGIQSRLDDLDIG